MLKKIAFALVIGSAAVLSACNTIDGAGEDIQSAGSAIEDAAD